ncbi:DNA translocase FtsK [Candidatus Babeliales bacterium]|nr:DNA translocase FtsK [Candidatus Babeliales bacterium]
MWRKKKFRRVSMRDFLDRQKQRFQTHAGKKATWYQKEVIGVGLTGLFIFLALALFSHNPQDPHLLNAGARIGQASNWAGIVGANVAALLVYFFGSAVYVLLACVMIPAYLFLAHGSVCTTRIRCIFLPMMLITSAGLCNRYGFDITNSYAGGLLGYAVCKLLEFPFGYGGTAIILWSLLWVSVSTIGQVSLLSLLNNAAQYGYWAVKNMIIAVSVATRWVVANAYWVFSTLFARGKKYREENEAFEPEDLFAPQYSDGFVVPLVGSSDFDPSRRPTGSSGRTGEVEGRPANASDYVNSYEWDGAVPGPRADTFPACPEEPVGRLEGCSLLVKKFANKIVRTFVRHAAEAPLRDRLFLPNSITKKNIFSGQPSAYVRVLDQAAVYKQAQLLQQKRFALPELELFDTQADTQLEQRMHDDALARGKKLEEKLQHFGVKGRVTNIKPGPVITLFEYQPEIDSKISKITALEDDLAMALSALSIRTIAPIPGKNAVGFEIANPTRENVYFSDVVRSADFENFQGELPLILGVDVVKTPVIVDLAKMPHLLVGGTTGSGKSVGLNAMLASLLCKCTPDQLRLILVDPKRLEFTPYADIPHLLFPIVTNPARATGVLKWVVQEMEERYERMAGIGVRNVLEYQRAVTHGMRDQEGHLLKPMPFIVVMIDELADLMIVAGKDVETHIVRIAQMARASGIHMIVATQRPSVDVVTGLIKVNFPSRVAFRVSSKVDSRTILDQGGAEKLLGRGDLLFMSSASTNLKRVHASYISDQEIQKLSAFLREQRKVQYLNLHEVLEVENSDGRGDAEDELFPEIIDFLKTTNEISISMLQRRYRIGFNRSARIIEQLEMSGLIAPAQGSKPRKVIR